MKTATVFGASGGLARSLVSKLLVEGWRVDAVCRARSADRLTEEFARSIEKQQLKILVIHERYNEFEFSAQSDVLILTQALFEPALLTEMSPGQIENEVSVGLTDQISLTRAFLRSFPPSSTRRRDICFIGSTSAYAGFKNTSVYCAVKHGL